MRTVDRLHMRAPVERVFDAASDVERWPELLIHYRWVRMLERREGGGVVEMAAWRPFGPVNYPTWWVSEMWVEPADRVVRYRHIRGITTGMDVEWRGRLYRWSKHAEFQRFLDLPAVLDRPLELALALDDADTIAMLEAAGWRVVPAGPLSKDVDRYRDYIRSSAGEFSVAKEQYVSMRTGWFSDRTACYLAAAKPAVVQDTAFGCALPTGEGLFAFEDFDDVVAAFAEIDADYPRHSDAARAIAEEYLDSDRVLGRLLEDAGLAAGSRAEARG